MKNALRWLLLLILVCGWSTQATAQPETVPDSTDKVVSAWEIHLSLVAGYKLLAPAWAPARHQIGLGLLDLDFGMRSWPVRIVIQLLNSTSLAVPRLEGLRGDYCGTSELNIGMRKIFATEGAIKPHIAAGGGVYFGTTQTTIPNFGNYPEEHARGYGGWGSAGFYWMASDALLVGMAAQYSSATGVLANQEIPIGGFQLLLYLGWAPR
ncbi:MAG: hypothetical protein H6Q30_717 [Bacteroidetes bacterium]|nr:hypothetical protein [Bacteroidota bacterium]